MARFFGSQAFNVIRIRDFRYFLMFRSFLTMAALMQSVVVGWHIYSLTNDVLTLGLIGLAEVIPQVSIALFAGHFIDLWDRKKIIQYASVILILGSAILVIYSLPAVDGYGRFGTVPIYITIFLTGLVRGILMPAHTALLSQLVTREQLTSATTWTSTNWQVAAVLGPAIGGLVYGFSGVTQAYSLIFIFYIAAFFLIMKVKAIRPLNAVRNGESIFNRIKEGIHFVFKNQVLLGAFSLDMFAVFFGGAVAVLPVFASDVLKTGPEGLGVLRACPAIGAIIMSSFLTLRPPVKNTGMYMLFAVGGFGFCMILFAVSRNFYLSAAALLISGSLDNISVVVRASVLQLFTPDEMKGRVAAVNSIFVGSSNELGAFESGVSARLIGLIPSVIFGGSMTLMAVLISARKAPLLRKLSLDRF